MTNATKNTSENTTKPINASSEAILSVLGSLEAKRIERELQRKLNNELTGDRLQGWLCVLRNSTILDKIDGIGGVVEYDYHIDAEALIDNFFTWYAKIGGECEIMNEAAVIKAAKKTIQTM